MARKPNTRAEDLPKSQATIYPEKPLCSHDGCFLESLCKVKTLYGWANLCEKHYQAHHQAQADETCKRLGLETIAQKRAWLKNHWPQMQAFDTAPAREPGDDDEPLPR